MPTFKTNFPKTHTKAHWVTKNMSREYLNQARRIAGLRGATGRKGATVESVILDCLGLGLDILETNARARLDARTVAPEQKAKVRHAPMTPILCGILAFVVAFVVATVWCS